MFILVYRNVGASGLRNLKYNALKKRKVTR